MDGEPQHLGFTTQGGVVAGLCAYFSCFWVTQCASPIVVFSVNIKVNDHGSTNY